MSSGLLFVTAPEADHKIINRLLLNLRDWEYGSGDRFKLVTTRYVRDLQQELLEQTQFEPTAAPVDVELQNAWAGATLEDIEAFCLTLDKAEDFGSINTHLYVVLDAEGVKDRTCVFAERAIHFEEDTDQVTFLDEFNKARVPWDQIYPPWCNLDIANMNWEEFMVEDDEEDVKDRWWTFSTSFSREDPIEERDDAILELERQGKA